MLRLVLLVAALLNPVITATAVDAQQQTPEAGPEASGYLPPAEALGSEWITQPAVGVTDLSTDVFREAAVGYYGGPDGARAVVMTLIATDARVAVRQAWEEASAIYDRYRYRLGGGDYERARELETIPPPAACEEVKRSEGTDNDYGFATAITLCAGGDAIVLAVVSGGDAASMRYEAADALAILAMEQHATAA